MNLVGSLQPLLGHDKQRSWFQNAIATGRLASTFLFVGPTGIGKRAFAIRLAQALLCQRVPATEMAPCGTCGNCIQIIAGTHPDLLYVRKPDDKATIPVEILIGPREARMREGLCHDLRLRPMSGDRRIAIIDDCDYLNQEGANSLLKTLEEPPPRALIILLGTSVQRQLPTIRSRCQIVRFAQPQGDDALLVMKHHMVDREVSDDECRHALRVANGDLSQALSMVDEDAVRFVEALDQQLAETPPSAIALAQLVTQFVDAGGTEASDRRERMRDVALFAAEFYRRRLRTLAANHPEQLDSHETRKDLFRIQRCLEMQLEVNRFANQATLIDAWVADIQRGQPI